MDVETAKEHIIDALEGRKELWEWITNLDNGFGTYKEASDAAELVGDIIADELTDYSPELLDAYLRAGFDIVSLMGEHAQVNLNNAAGIGLSPMKTKYPKAKTDSLTERLAELTEELIPDELRVSIPTLMLTYVDDMEKYNLDFQAKAGLEPIIVRTWSGRYPSHDTKHTDWCHDLAGRYRYGTEPRNVYARHKGCRCKVEYFPNSRAQGRITALAKGEIDYDGVLWNTRSDTLEDRIRRSKRNK